METLKVITHPHRLLVLPCILAHAAQLIKDSMLAVRPNHLLLPSCACHSMLTESYPLGKAPFSPSAKILIALTGQSELVDSHLETAQNMAQD